MPLRNLSIVRILVILFVSVYSVSCSYCNLNVFSEKLDSVNLFERVYAVDVLIGLGKDGVDEIKKKLCIEDGVMKVLVEKWYNIKTRDKRGCTLLHYAAEKGNIEFAELLLARGMDPNDYVLFDDLVMVMHPDKWDDEYWTPLHFAAREGHVDMVLLLIENGANVDGRNSNNNDGPLDIEKASRTPLYLAAEKGRKKIASLLISKGATVNTIFYDYFPIHSAAENGHKELVELLVDSGAIINIRDILGWTPLHSAVYDRQLEIVKLLIKLGAMVNVRNEFGKTPLHDAILKGHDDIAKILISAGADVNAKVIKENGKLMSSNLTPFYLGVQLNRRQLVQIMLENKAMVNIVHWNKTPLDWVLDRSDSDMVKLLRKHGAKTKAELDASDK